MRLDFDKASILGLIAELDRLDPERALFGAGAHDYLLEPPLPGSRVEAFESRAGLKLPPDYRYFITEIANGGAGPSFGLLPFDVGEDGLCFAAWREKGLLGKVSQPFIHQESWNLPDSFWDSQPESTPGMSREEEKNLLAAWDKKLREEYWNPEIMNGAIPICDHGDETLEWLVLKGPERGYVWTDARAMSDGLYGSCDRGGNRLGFADWYLGWIRTAFSELGAPQPT